MRVSTLQVFNGGLQGIQRNQGDLYKTQNQLATGRRVLTPADDPIAASQALVVGQSKAINTQYMENQALAKSTLGLAEVNLTSVVNELQNVLQRAVQAGSSALDATQKGMIAQDLKGSLENILGLANAQDGDGRFLFAGFKTQAQPFGVTGNGAPYNLSNQYIGYSGDNGQRKLQVSASQEMSISEAGPEVFMEIRDGRGNLTGRSMFDSIKNLANILDPNSGVAFSQATYDQSLNDVRAAIESVSRVRASVGSRLAAIDSLGENGNDLDLQYEGRLSELQDVDYAKAITDLTFQRTQLEASQKSFAQINQLSLFNFI